MSLKIVIAMVLEFVTNICLLVPTDQPDKVEVDGLMLDLHEARMIQYTNEYRVRMGKRPLKASRKLMGLSRTQAYNQTRLGMRHGFTRGWSAENIAAGQRSSQEAINAWINSSGHRANMLGNYRYIGVGGYSYQWAQQFGN
jgi:uncharacterized protein YkwD